MAGQQFSSSETREIYISALQNAHALEAQAVQLINRQLERLENYPEVANVLQKHLGETEHQIQRLDEMLGSLGSNASMLKDMATSFTGNMAAITHAMMPDEILKNSFANQAFENFEIASYMSLITMAEAGGQKQHLKALHETLAEEERMAQWFKDHIPDITRRYLSLSETGTQADR